MDLNDGRYVVLTTPSVSPFSKECGGLDVLHRYGPPRSLIGTALYFNFFYTLLQFLDRLCGLVVRVLGYRFGGPGSIPALPIKKVVDLERGPLSLMSTTEELLDRKVAAPV
jgi:hypothetical protein